MQGGDDRGVGVGGVGVAIEHHAVAGFDAHPGGDRLKLWRPLANEGDRAEGHPLAIGFGAVGLRDDVNGLANRVGQIAQTFEHFHGPQHALGGKLEPVEQDLGHVTIAAGFQIEGVGFENVVLGRSQGLGHRLDRLAPGDAATVNQRRLGNHTAPHRVEGCRWDRIHRILGGAGMRRRAIGHRASVGTSATTSGRAR